VLERRRIPVCDSWVSPDADFSAWPRGTYGKRWELNTRTLRRDGTVPRDSFGSAVLKVQALRPTRAHQSSARQSERSTGSEQAANSRGRCDGRRENERL